jgi:3-hydroxymyristoyl/3-hydroxydecanoyl-(acyl carrier protein) dehydratase
MAIDRHEWSETLRIDPAHPCLPGHFPGQPVVPGVVLLDRVAALLQREGAGTLARIGQVKFRAPLLPDEGAELCVVREARRIRFRVSRGETLLMSGEGELA